MAPSNDYDSEADTDNENGGIFSALSWRFFRAGIFRISESGRAKGAMAE